MNIKSFMSYVLGGRSIRFYILCELSSEFIYLFMDNLDLNLMGLMFNLINF